MRATSSIRSASIAMSKRCGGGVTRQPSCVGSTRICRPSQARSHACVREPDAQKARQLLATQLTAGACRQMLADCFDGDRPGLPARDFQQQGRRALYRALLV